jgi:hypothetical protein
MRNSCKSIPFSFLSHIKCNVLPASIACIAVIILSVSSFVYAVEPYEWNDEFEEICSMVQIGDTLTREELRTLIERADRLMPKIQSSDHPSRRIYIFRLKKCRSFFLYIIELKQSEKSPY